MTSQLSAFLGSSPGLTRLMTPSAVARTIGGLSADPTGTSPTTFSPDSQVTREQLATILYRYAQEKQYDVSGRNDLSAFADAARVSAYAKEAMQWAVDAGLISGIGDNLVPQNGANRAQVATMLMRFAENVNQ